LKDLPDGADIGRCNACMPRKIRTKLGGVPKIVVPLFPPSGWKHVDIQMPELERAAADVSCWSDHDNVFLVTIG
jgi:hypothetical protein